jgi:hypothetical protein
MRCIRRVGTALRDVADGLEQAIRLVRVDLAFGEELQDLLSLF